MESNVLPLFGEPFGEGVFWLKSVPEGHQLGLVLGVGVVVGCGLDGLHGPQKAFVTPDLFRAPTKRVDESEMQRALFQVRVRVDGNWGMESTGVGLLGS